MLIEDIPKIYTNQKKEVDLFVYDLKMQNDIVKAKVSLTAHMFSFLQAGEKKVNLPNTSIKIDSSQSLLIKKGNCIWSELINKEENYHCRLLFFSEKRLIEFLNKYAQKNIDVKQTSSHFIIENDSYIDNYLNSLSTVITAPPAFMDSLLSVKFEELLLYLLNKYQKPFELYLHSLISEEICPFHKLITQNIHSNLSLEEIAFLSNMSLSTFKRKFTKKFETSPGKWLQEKRLQKTKELLTKGGSKPSDIYLDLGYNNLSNFSIAFKKQFGVNPSEI